MTALHCDRDRDREGRALCYGVGSGVTVSRTLECECGLWDRQDERPELGGRTSAVEQPAARPRGPGSWPAAALRVLFSS